MCYSGVPKETSCMKGNMVSFMYMEQLVPSHRENIFHTEDMTGHVLGIGKISSYKYIH